MPSHLHAILCFGPFRLDAINAQLWRETQPVRLTTKAFLLLSYLAQRSGQLVTKDEVFEAVWPDTVVSDATLSSNIQAVRQALGDNSHSPQYLETVHRRGFRFIAKVVSSQHSVVSSPSSPPTPDPRPPISTLVGREKELAHLHNCLDKALHGERQMVFVTGEPGIGKTALGEAFLASIGHWATGNRDQEALPPPPPRPDARSLTPGAWLGQGQCIEQYGAGEAYLPLLSALGQVGRGPDGHQLIAFLRQQAPTWLVQLPALLTDEELGALQRKTAGVTKERMLRELAEALEVIAAARPLVLVLEDLHWSDPSTLDLLAFVARRSHPARLFILGSYRPVEMLSDGHPLQRMLAELYAHQWGHELALQPLTGPEVHTYLLRRFPESVLPARLGQVLHQRTGGNPLFLTSMVQELVQRGVLNQTDDGIWTLQGEIAELERWTPGSVRHLLVRQRERLAPEEQHVLEAASLAGQEFSAATVAAALETEVIPVEQQCGRLAEQQHFLRRVGLSEWPDGTRAERYGFLHAVYQEFWHERVSMGQLQQWHLRMGERKELAYGQRAGEIAAELALHFEQGRDHRRAVRYLQMAGENAVRRNAHQEAITHFTQGLALLKTLPDTRERTQQELALQLPLGSVMFSVRGYTAVDAEKVYTQTQALCQQLGETPRLITVLWSQVTFFNNRGQLQKGRELAEEMLRLAQQNQDQYLIAKAHGILGWTLYLLGELISARLHLEESLALYDPYTHPQSAFFTHDLRMDYLSFLAWTLWDLGYPDQALQRSRNALVLAGELSIPFALAVTSGFAALLHIFRREGRPTQALAERVISITTEQGFPYWLAYGMTERGWALADQGQVEEGITHMQQGITAFRDIRTELGLPWFLAMLAEAYGKVRRFEEGLTVLNEALAIVDKIDQRMSEAELWRIKGELLLAQEGSRLQALGFREKTEEAETCFLKAIDIARKQQAKSWELRAVMSLSRLWQQQSKKDEAHKLLAEIYGWFTEGFDTKDLQEAKALLEELGQ